MSFYLFRRLAPFLALALATLAAGARLVAAAAVSPALAAARRLPAGIGRGVQLQQREAVVRRTLRHHVPPVCEVKQSQSRQIRYTEKCSAHKVNRA